MMMEEIQDLYALSPLQQGMLFHSAYAENTGMYVTQLAVSIKGPLDTAAFGRAWQQVIDRHSIFRTGFIWGETEQPLQMVYHKVAAPFEVLDWCHVSTEQLPQELAAYRASERLQDFSLTDAPLMRIRVIQTGEQRYELVWTYHHVLLDGWSLPIVLQELFAFYEANRRGEKLALPATRPYQDYIKWLRAQDQSAVESFWKQYLAGIEAPTSLNQEKPSTTKEQAGYETIHTLCDVELSQQLQTFSKRHQITLNTLVQAAWALLLHHYSSDREVVYGATVSGRPADLPDVERMIGLFINTLPVRVSIDEEMTVLQWLQNMQQEAAELRQYEHSSLLDVQTWSEVPQGTPLFETLFVFENYPMQEATTGSTGELQFSNVHASEQTNYPLTLLAAPGASLSLKLMYDKQQFRSATIERMLQDLPFLLEQIVTLPQERLQEITLLTPADRQRWQAWNETKRAFPAEKTIVQLFEEQVGRSPERVAIYDGAQKFCYKEINEQANRLAHQLQKMSVRTGDRVGLCVNRSVDMVIALVAIMKIGAAYVPLDPAYPTDRIRFMISDAQVAALITETKIADVFTSYVAPTLLIDQRDQWMPNPSAPVISTATSDSLAYLIYTSGSTGRPKGVMIEHRQAVALISWAKRIFSPEELQVVLASTSICFDLSVFELFVPLCSGGSLLIVDNALEIAKMPNREQVTLINTVPSAAGELVRQGAIPSSVLTINLAGEPLMHSLASDLYQHTSIQRLYNLYGPSEDTTYSTYALVSSTSTSSPTIGRPIDNTTTYILDRQMRLVPAGIVGELYLGGEGVTRGYWNREELTNERYIDHAEWGRLYRTGDLVRYLDDGEMQFLGRIDHQVKVRGFRIELGEIEEVLRAHPDVEETVVVVYGEHALDRRLIAYVVAQEEQNWRSYVRDRLPDYMIPNHFILLDRLPHTPNGKIDRRALPAPDVQTSQGTVDQASSPLEQIVTGIWEDVLQRDKVTPTDHFFELGGHSLLATQVISRLEAALQVSIPLRTLFEAPTIAEFVPLIEHYQQGEQSSLPLLVPQQTEGNEFPLSYSQQRVWFIEQLTPGDVTYQMPFAVRICGKIDRDRLQRALQRMVAKHEILRTTFVNREGEAVQVVHPKSSVQLQEVQLTTGDTEAEAAMHIQHEMKQTFDLSQGPLLRLFYYQLADEEAILMVHMHHLITDGWSTGIWMRELFSNDEMIDQPLPVQYKDYTLWQRDWLQGERYSAQLAHWKERLAQVPMLELPLDYPRPKEQMFAGGNVTFALPPELSERVKRLSRQEDVTPYMTLLASYKLLLSRYSGQPDVTVGTPIANRHQQVLENLIGFFVNTLALRTDLSGNLTGRELLERVRETAMEAYAHQDIPFEKIVDELGLDRDLSRTPLFQTMFVFQNLPFASQSIEGLAIQPYELDHAVSKFDLTMTMMESEQGELLGNIEYNLDLFKESTIERMVTHFQQILWQLVKDPDQSIDQLTFITDEEQAQLLRWSENRLLYSQTSLAVEFERQVELNPNKVALRQDDVNLTYQELNRQANRLAHRLREQGVKRDQLVGLYLERSPQLFIAMLGILKAGAAYVPFDLNDPVERLTEMVTTAKLTVLITHSAQQDRLASLSVRQLLVDQPDAWSNNAENPVPVNTCDDRAYVMYTSGSTGKPKGVEITQRGVLRLVAMDGFAEFGAAEVFLQLAPVAFDASTLEIWGSLLHGATLVIMAPGTPSLSQLATVLEQERITTLWLTVGLFNLMVEHQLHALAGLKQLLVGGDVVSPSHVKKVLSLGSVSVINGYGPTENTTFTCCYPIPHDWAGQGSIPIGRPIANTRVYVLDEQRQLLPIGVAGELWIGGDGLARGYLHQPELTRERFIDHPQWGRLYRTGDRVRYLQDGNLAFLGRLDHQIKLRGYRIEQGEIEEALRSHDTVQEATVVVHNKQLFAYLLGVDVEDISYDQWRSYLQTKLPEYMIPVAFIPVKSIPLTRNGKIDRQRLPKPDSSLYSHGKTFEKPRNEIEEQLLTVWKEVLGRESISIHDNFFRLGGDSILSIQIVAKCKRYRLQLTPKRVFEHQTIAALAKQVEIQQSVVEEVPQGEMPLAPIQQWFFAQEITPRDHWNQAMMLAVNERMTSSQIQSLVQKLVAQHDALRLRFAKRADHWTQWYGEIQQPASCEWVDLHHLTTTQQQAAIERIAQRTQAQLDLYEGPVFRAVYFNLGSNQLDRLLLVAHHLVIDGVSWRILLDDLELLAAGMALPPRTTSYQQWSQSLSVEDFSDEQDDWIEVISAANHTLPRDLDDGLNTEDSAALVTVQLEPEESQQLLQHRIPVTELLLSAFAQVMGEWMETDNLLIHLEGHGREEIDEQIDLSRTVGWFTSLYPLRLSTDVTCPQIERLQQLHRQLRKMGKQGMGYGVLRYLGTDHLPPEPHVEVSFNYLGQFTESQTKGRFQNIGDATGQTIHPDSLRPYLLDVIAVTAQGRLSVSWKYSKHAHLRETISRLAEQMMMQLRQLMVELAQEESFHLLPGDFPLATVDPAALLQRIERSTDVENLYPVTPLQQGMLFHSLYSQHQDDYITQLSFTLRGEVVVEKLHDAWQTIMQRHAVLRTGFLFPSEGEPHQIVYQQVNCPFAQMDWRRLSPIVQEHRLEQQLLQERQKGFAFAAPPLMRFVLIRLTDDRYRLIWTHHHVLLDGWSIPLIFNEWLALYLGKELPPVQKYEQYIAWLQQQERGEAKQYWQKQLTGFTNPVRIPVESEQQKDISPAEVTEWLSIELSEGLRRFAREQQVTLNTVLQGAWGLLLRRLCGQEDLVYGVTSSGRPAELAGVDQMVGFFINTLPVRLHVKDESHIGEWLRAMQQQQSEMRQFDYLPLVEIQGCSDVPSGVPLFETLFVFENYPLTTLSEEKSAAAIQIENLVAFDQSHFPFTVVTGPGEQISLKIKYDQSRFSATLIEQYRQYYHHILCQMVLQPTAKLGEISLLTKAEEQQLLVEWNQTDTEYARDSTVAEQFSWQVERTPGAIALICGDEQLTYGECEEQANQLAHYLIQQGIQPGDRVGVGLGRSVEYVVSLLAILKAGAAYVPFDSSYPPATLRLMIEDTGTEWVITDHKRQDLFRQQSIKRLLIDELRQRILEQERSVPQIERQATDLAYLMYTSGSTGKPKGVKIAHRSILRLVQNVNYAELTADHTFLLLAPTAFDASTFEIWGSLLNGARLVILPEDKPSLASIAHAITRYQVTTMWLTAGLFALMADHQLNSLQRLQQLLVGGDVVSATHVQKVLVGGGTQIINGYGPTEATTFACCYAIPQDFQGFTVPIGRPISNTQVYVLDERLQPVPVGTVGELYIGGDGLALGYWNQDERTAEKFIAHPYHHDPTARLYRTGDLVRYLPDGNLTFIGRQDQQIKVRGYRVERTAIEHTLLQHTAVDEAVVVVDQQKKLIAYVMGAASTEELKAHVAERLPAYMVPTQVVHLDRLPLTANGKIDHRALPKPTTDQCRARAETEEERQLVQMWKQVLEIDEIGIDDHFFALGGHSFHAMQLMATIEERFAVVLPLATLFESPTIRELAKQLTSRHESSTSFIQLQRGERGTQPLFLIHPQGGGVLSFAPLVALLDDNIPIYGLQSIGYEGEELPLATMEMMAERYLEQIRSAQPKGPYRLLGWSFGGCLALELTRLIEARGESVEWVGLLDSTWLPDTEKESFIEELTHPETIQAQANALEVGTASPKVVVWLQNGLAFANYRPQGTIQSDLYLFRARENINPVGCYEWAAITTGHYEQIDCLGDHQTMLAAPHVDHLARQMKRLVRGRVVKASRLE